MMLHISRFENLGKWQTLLLIILCFSFGSINSQEHPPFKNYDLSDHGAGRQTWSISQGKENTLFFGNNSGLLEFNGSAWKLYATPNGTIVRSVGVRDDRIYTGFYMDFGFWQRDGFGDLVYTSLIDKVQGSLIEDEHFWNITFREEWVLFQSLHRIYLFNTISEEIVTIDFEMNRAMIFNLEQGIFLQGLGTGLFTVKNGSVEMVSDLKVFRDEVVIGLYDRPGGMLVVTEGGGFHHLDEQASRELSFHQVVPEGVELYSSYQLRDGTLILGTVSNGFLRVNESEEVVQKINQEDGLMNNTVLSIFEDRDSNVWLGLDNGISVINLQSAFSEYRDVKGKLGAVYASFVTPDWMYLGTNQGLFFKKRDSDDAFSLIRDTNGQVWSLKAFGNDLFCGHNKGTFLIKGNRAELISTNSGTWDILSVPDKPHLLLQGNYNGLSTLVRKGDGWVYGNKISGFDISSRSLVLDGDQIIVNHEFKGLYQLKIDENFTEVLETKAIERIGYDSNIFSYNNRILFSSNQGVHEFDTERSELIPDDYLNEVFYSVDDAVTGRLLVDPEDKIIWGFANNNIIFSEQDQFDGDPRHQRLPVQANFRQNLGLTGFENVLHLGDRSYLIGTSTGYVVLNLPHYRDINFIVHIDAISKHFEDGNEGKVLLNETGRFPYDQNDLNFRFSVPVYDQFKETEFQYQLLGLNEEWSAWSGTPQVNYGYLPYGEYTFVLRARVGDTLSVNQASYSFIIERPWYLSVLAILFYTVMFVSSLLLIHRSYRRHYKRQQAKLVEENKKNLELAKLANEREIMNIRNEQLQKDIDSKNRELASATMSLINKNELLQGLKKDLSNLQDQSSRDQVIRIIDKNLNNERDWEHFEEAFNNADKDFLKKIRQLHPDLTSSDLKLCAYLRLNLSSKEIAPLLNISVRSVEIKRYRLRKKMKLDREKNLVDYILGI